MDNLCHTLVGASLAEAGLKKRTALATAALVIGANLPDVDVLTYAWGRCVAGGGSGAWWWRWRGELNARSLRARKPKQGT